MLDAHTNASSHLCAQSMIVVHEGLRHTCIDIICLWNSPIYT